jgi:hypothetical protein
MKKFLAVLTVVALVCLSSMAFAADVTVGGSLEVRSRDFSDLLMFNTHAPYTAAQNASNNQVDTQERIRLDVNAKAGDDVKGKIELEQDYGSGAQDWGTSNGGPDLPVKSYNTGASSALGFREAWLSVNLPGLPVNVTAGHQLLQLGNGWFFRSKHFGSDAWVVSNQTGNNTLAVVDVKIGEGAIYTNDDIDAYVLLDVYKLSDTATVGADLTVANDPRNTLGFGGASTEATQAQNLGLNFNGKTGPVNLHAEADMQMGKAKGNDAKFKGNQVVVQGTMPVDPVTLNFTVARGSGNKINGSDYDGYQNFLDIDPHYTFLYEYKIAAPVNSPLGNQLHQGFANTTALNIGGTFAAAKSLNIGANLWYLMATEKVPNVKTGSGTTNNIGTELDVNIAWQLYQNVSWNWDLGYFDPGDGMGKDAATGIQGVLAFKF